ncbi:hypothetical protein PRO82_001423 [Candidatus Protochlamydia amoebophila]|nr:hypothetical protein [Candidatus Protochlamydia amoebophila]
MSLRIKNLPCFIYKRGFMYIGDSASPSVNTTSNSSIDEANQIQADVLGQKIKMEAIKNYALNFLGHGYNSLAKTSESKLLQRTLVKFSTDIVNVQSANSCDEYAIGATNEEASEKIKKSYEARVDLPCYIATIGARINYKSSKNSEEGADKIVFAACHIDYSKCTFDQFPELRRDLLTAGCEVKGDSFVSSGWVYTGYKIFFEIDIEWQTEESQKNFQIEADVEKGSVGLGAHADRLNKSLANRKIMGITMHAKGFGGYSIPTNSFSPPQNAEGINQVIQTIHIDYLAKVNQLMTRKFFINEECLTSYDVLPIPCFPKIYPKHSPAVETSHEPIIVNFRKLAEQIHTYNNGKLRSELGTIQLNELFTSMVTIFSDIESKFRGSSLEDYTLVIGATGAGKSTLIGYLQGAEIIYKKIPIMGLPTKFSAVHKFETVENLYEKFLNKIPKKLVAVYKTKQDALYPEIGHHNAKTKAFGIYKNYIDTAGIFDSAGPTEDICNAEAIHMATKVYSPKKMIVLINSASFEHRSHVFLEMIDRLKRVVRNPTDESVMSSILFVVNDKLSKTRYERKSKKEVIKGILDAIKSLEEEKQALLPKDPTWWEWLRGQTPEDQKRAIKGSVNDARVDDYDNKIKILATLLKLHNNIIVADIFSEQTRQKIKAWEEKEISLEPSSDPLSFTMENFVDGGHDKFKAALRETAGYFLHLFSTIQQLNQALNGLKIEITDTEFQISAEEMSVNSLGKMNIQAEISKKRKEFESNNKKIARSKTELKEVKEKIAEKMRRKEKLQTDKEIFWKKMSPNKPITPRSFFAAGFLATKYVFSIDDKNTPINRVKLIPGKSQEKITGSFCDEKRSGLNEGKYIVSYKPGWHGYQEDCKAKVKLYVKTKDHPSSKTELAQIEQDLNGIPNVPNTGLIAQQKNLTIRINALKGRNSVLSGEKYQLETQGKLIESNKQNIRDYSDKLNCLKLSQAEIDCELQPLKSTLDVYKDFCQLIGKIIKNLKLDESENSSERNIFNQFLDEFCPEDGTEEDIGVEGDVEILF